MRQVTTVQAIYLSAAFGLILGLPCIWFAPDFFRLYGADEQIVGIGADYLRIVGGSSIVPFLMGTLGSVFRGIQDSKTPLKAGIWMNICHLLLTALFIFVFHFGVMGVAYATLIARFVGMIYLIPVLHRKIFKGTKCSWQLDWFVLKRLMTQSLSLIGSGLSNEIVMFYFFRIFIPFGVEVYAASRITVQIKNVLMPSVVRGYANAVIALVGEQYGKRKYREVISYCNWAIGLVVLEAMVIWLLHLLFSDWVTGLFTDDPEVIAYVSLMLIMFMIIDTFWGIASIVNSALKGVSYTRPIFISWIVSSIVLASGVWVISKYNFGWQAMFYAEIAQYVILTLLVVVYFYSRAWIHSPRSKTK
jgi:putative MATE family efflux protein